MLAADSSASGHCFLMTVSPEAFSGAGCFKDGRPLHPLSELEYRVPAPKTASSSCFSLRLLFPWHCSPEEAATSDVSLSVSSSSDEAEGAYERDVGFASDPSCDGGSSVKVTPQHNRLWIHVQFVSLILFDESCPLARGCICYILFSFDCQLLARVEWLLTPFSLVLSTSGATEACAEAQFFRGPREPARPMGPRRLRPPAQHGFPHQGPEQADARHPAIAARPQQQGRPWEGKEARQGGQQGAQQEQPAASSRLCTCVHLCIPISTSSGRASSL